MTTASIITVLLITVPVCSLNACPELFYQAARVILHSPFLSSSDPSLNLACHSCIASVAETLDHPPLCKVPGMEGYDSNYLIQNNCHCLTLGLNDKCSSKCLPNPICTAHDSMKPECTACVQREHEFCKSNWNITCIETCEKPTCIKECSIHPQCHPHDEICRDCVVQNSACDLSLASYDRNWSTSCTEQCFHDQCIHECNRVCGDNHKTIDEICDGGVGCTRNCENEPGYTCFQEEDQGPTICSNCGNLILEGNETCEHPSQDGCNENCELMPGYQCSNNECTIVEALCGNGKVDSGEECDDGNTESNDGCSQLCTVEPKWICTEQNDQSKCEYKITCGDGEKEGDEECDDGNTDPNDGCNSSCQIENGWICIDNKKGLSTCNTMLELCGNGMVEAHEECDTGKSNGIGCSSICKVEPGYQCTAPSNTPSTCSLKLECGNGVVQSENEEECDSGDGCTDDCKIMNGYSCIVEDNKSHCSSICNDGYHVSGVEECDTGTNSTEGGCLNCKIQKGFRCWTQDNRQSMCRAICSDGWYISSQEECDDGNSQNGDGCSSDCRIEDGYTCFDNSNHSSTCRKNAVCGNGELEFGEDCDDGNIDSFDGCSSRCKIERGFRCSVPGSLCSPSRCNNVRRDWKSLESNEKQIFQNCINEAFRRGIYQKLVGIHVYAANDLYAHYTNGFVAWHRKWLLAFENMLRSFGGDCTCVTLPYWDWGEEAALMQVNNCTTKEECSPTMQDWGGGGNVDSQYVNYPVFNDPNATEPIDTASGYCVLNSITQHWRANNHLGPIHLRLMNASCPIIRRGWNDWRDERGTTNYASPMVASSFLGIANGIGQSRSYAEFANVLSGDIHILPHDNAGGILTTFMSPADPLFILHHTNIDRLWAIWEGCHGCTTVSTAMRTQNSHCYNAKTPIDGITQQMSFWHFEMDESGVYRRVFADHAQEFREWWPQGLLTPGDMLSIATLGSHAYSYAVDELDEQLLQSGQCRSNSLGSTAGFLFLVTHQSADTEMMSYLYWLQRILEKTKYLIDYLKEFDVFELSWFESVAHEIHLHVTEIAATCECMHIAESLNAKLQDQQPILHDVSPYTKRLWTNKDHTPSCFHRLTDEQSSKYKTEREYCQVILGNDFNGDLFSLTNWLTTSIQWFQDEASTSPAQSMFDFITNLFKKK